MRYMEAGKHMACFGDAEWSCVVEPRRRDGEMRPVDQWTRLGGNPMGLLTCEQLDRIQVLERPVPR